MLGSALVPAASGHRRTDGQETITVKFFEAGFRPQASLLERSRRCRTETVDAQYAGPAVDLVLTTRADVATTQRIEIPSDVREAVTLPMLVRALPLARGYATQLNSFLPVAGTLERVTVRVVGDESLPVAAGLYDTWVVLLDTGDTVADCGLHRAPPIRWSSILMGAIVRPSNWNNIRLDRREISSCLAGPVQLDATPLFQRR
jgi:hypothetical protein